MQGNKIDFSHIIRVIRHEFAKVRQDELVKSNIKKLDYLEGMVLGLIKLIRDVYNQDREKYSK